MALFAVTSVLPAMAQENDPVVTEYDVDPSWPKRPEHVSGKGWVSGLAVDDQDQVWFFRKGPDPVQVYTADGDFVRTWGKDQFINPHHLRIDHDGNIWVADFGLHIVQKFSPEGEELMTLGIRGEKGTDERHFNMPTDMAITKSGDIFVTDGYGRGGTQRVVHFTKDGGFVKAFGMPAPNQASCRLHTRLSWILRESFTSPIATADEFSSSIRKANSSINGPMC